MIYGFSITMYILYNNFVSVANSSSGVKMPNTTTFQ